MIQIIAAGFLIALAYAAPPGPVLIETIRRGMRHGFPSGLAVQLGSIIGDSAWCAAALIGAAPLLQTAWLRVPWTVLGTGILLYLGIRAFRDGLREKQSVGEEHWQERSGAFRSGLVISIGNPMALGYWFAVGGAMAASGLLGSATLLEEGAFAFGFLLAMVGWAFCMAALAGWGRHMPGIWFFRSVHLACGCFLFYFAFQMAMTLLLHS
jgi:threonine/homoserine/homoserine lactone efflux protein